MLIASSLTAKLQNALFFYLKHEGLKEGYLFIRHNNRDLHVCLALSVIQTSLKSSSTLLTVEELDMLGTCFVMAT